MIKMKKLLVSVIVALLFTACSSTRNTVVESNSSSEEVVYEDSSIRSSDISEIPEEDKAVASLAIADVLYPAAALENEVSGTVLLKFSINSKGEVENITVISERLGWGLEEEAIRVLKMTNGKWKPRQGSAKVYYVLPVKFEIH